MGSKTVSLQINHFQHLKVSRWDKKKSQRDQNGIGATIHKVQRVPVGAHTHKLHYILLQQRDSSIYIAIWLVIYNMNSIQKLMNQANWRSSAIMTLWGGQSVQMTCVMDDGIGQLSFTPRPSLSEWTIPWDRYRLIDSINKYEWIKRTWWRQKKTGDTVLRYSKETENSSLPSFNHGRCI